MESQDNFINESLILVFLDLFVCVVGVGEWGSVLFNSCGPGTITRQAPLSMEFSRQEYWNGLPCHLPGDLSDSGIEPASLVSPALAGEFFTTSSI